MANKFYAVAVGREPGIYTDWPLAKRQVDGFAGALYKGFPDRAEAEAWLKNPSQPRRRKQTEDTGQQTAGKDAVAGDGISVYTDGSCLGNPGPGGYGVIIHEGGQERQLSGGFRHTTNNRMEIMAAIAGLKAAGAGKQPIHLYSDSSYLVNAIDKGWAKNWARRGWRKADGQPAQNPDLWREILDLLAERKVVWHWLRGHMGHRENERCDRLALMAAKSADLPEDSGYHVGKQL
jgi:ribonuclease HI